MRLLAATRTDVLVQVRNQLYPISVLVSLIVGGVLSWLSSAETLARTFPMALLMFVGGSTLLYVVAMIILEKDDGTLAAICVSPLRTWEYLGAKVVSLTGIATLEGVLITAGALAVMVGGGLTLGSWPNLWLLVGLIALSIQHVLIGIVIVVRYDRLTEVLMPMGGIATIMQLPALYFVGALTHPSLLLIPTAGPTMLIRAAFVSLAPWEWAYGLGMTAVTLVGFGLWSLRAFETHVARKVG